MEAIVDHTWWHQPGGGQRPKDPPKWQGQTGLGRRTLILGWALPLLPSNEGGWTTGHEVPCGQGWGRPWGKHMDFSRARIRNPHPRF